MTMVQLHPINVSSPANSYQHTLHLPAVHDGDGFTRLRKVKFNLNCAFFRDPNALNFASIPSSSFAQFIFMCHLPSPAWTLQYSRVSRSIKGRQKMPMEAKSTVAAVFFLLLLLSSPHFSTGLSLSPWYARGDQWTENMVYKERNLHWNLAGDEVRLRQIVLRSGSS